MVCVDATNARGVCGPTHARATHDTGAMLSSRIVEALVPARLGRNFRWLWSSFVVANVGDGILFAAGPLLVASITRRPIAVAMVVFLQRLPWLLFGIFAGAVIDRVDRRRLTVAVDLLRSVVIGTLAIVIVSDSLSLPVVYAVMFATGTAETFADNASSTLVAATVPRAHLGVANARLIGANVVTNQLAGPPIGGVLLGFGLAAPFGTTAACFLFAAVLVGRLRHTERPVSRDDVDVSLRRDVAEGLRWLWRHDAVRTLVLLITAFNITFGAAFGVWVLYALERLGLHAVGFGLLLSAGAIGGLVGSVLYGRLETRWSYATLLRVGLTIETCTHLALALTSTAWLAGVIMMLFGAHAVTWGTLADTIRQRAVPAALLGRVTSVYMLGSVGSIAFGTLLGGVLADRFGVLAPFWFAFVGAGLTTLLVWRRIGLVADAGTADEPTGDDEDAPD
ncbi:MFS transporter [soil metagenome]